MGDWWQKNWKTLVYAVICVLILVVIVYIFGIRPNQQLEEAKVRLQPKEYFELKNNIRTALAQAIGGAILLIGLFFTWRNIRATEKNVEIAQQNIRLNQDTAAKNLVITQKNLEITQENIRNTQENTAKTIRISQEAQITERFTGAIEQIGNLESVTVRLGGIYALERIAHDSDKDHRVVMEVLTAFVRENARWTAERAARAESNLAADIQAILTVLGRRKLDYERERDSAVSLRGTDLRSGDFNLARLGRIDLKDAHLEGATFFGAHLEKANPGKANFTRAAFTLTHLEDAILDKSDFTRAEFIQSHLTGTSFNNAILDHAHFKLANLQKAQFSNAVLNGAIFEMTDLTGAILYNSQLKGAIFLGNLSDAKLFDADIDGANLEGATGLTLAQIKSARNYDKSSLPEEIRLALQADSTAP